MKRSQGPRLVCFALIIPLALSACRTVGRTGGDRSGGSSRLGVEGTEEDHARAVARAEKAVLVASNPAEKARSHLSLGYAWLDAGDPRAALQAFYDARKSYHAGEQASATNRALGEAYFELAEFVLARRYLEKGIIGAGEGDREQSIARLVVSCRELGDAEASAAYRSRLAKPYSPDVRTILAAAPRPPTPGDEGLAPVVARDAAGTGVAPSPTTVPDTTGAEKLLVLSREYWNASAVRANVEPMGRITKITIHHTGGPDYWGKSVEDAATEIHNIQRYHQDRRGWADIGYHYVIDRNGNVWQGRRLAYQGAHARGSLNSGNIGIVVLGNFCHQRPTRAQYRSLAVLVEKLCQHFRISTDQVYTHGELASGKTSCPGPALTSCVTAMRSYIQKRLVAYRVSAVRP